MSGQLVGEVLAAADSLQARDVSRRAFYALIAIAEKAGVDSRQGSVRWGHIRAGLYGASQRTAERAVQELKSAGLIRVVRPGFNNNHGRSAAPIYEIQRLSDSDTQVAELVQGDTDTDVAESVQGDTDTQVAESVQGDTDNNGGRYRQNGGRYRHPGGVLDGSIDGSPDGESWVVGRWGPRCTKPDHVDNPNPPACPGCGYARTASKALAEESRRAAREAEAARRTRCPDCGGGIWLLAADGAPVEPAVRCDHRNSRRAS